MYMSVRLSIYVYVALLFTSAFIYIQRWHISSIIHTRMHVQSHVCHCLILYLLTSYEVHGLTWRFTGRQWLFTFTWKRKMYSCLTKCRSNNKGKKKTRICRRPFRSIDNMENIARTRIFVLHSTVLFIYTRFCVCICLHAYVHVHLRSTGMNIFLNKEVHSLT